MIAWLKGFRKKPLLPVLHVHTLDEEGMYVRRKENGLIYPGVVYVTLTGYRICTSCGAQVDRVESHFELSWYPGNHFAPTQEAWNMIYEHIGYEEVKRWQSEQPSG